MEERHKVGCLGFKCWWGVCWLQRGPIFTQWKRGIFSLLYL